ncbi:MAG: sporulation protein YtfJ [Clostridia bacterium]|nr:sporulation protein YtfJ [Clostridia bacterium]
MAENKQSEIIKTALDSIKTIIDANTVIGDPIVTGSGTTIIPVSKITVGYASGGIDYMKKDTPVHEGKPVFNNFGGGGGTGISVIPVAFIVVDADGKTNILNMEAPVLSAPEDAVSKILSFIDRSPELIEKFKEIFAKK